MAFGRRFENEFLNQKQGTARTMTETLDLGWELLSALPRKMLDRVDEETLDEHYKAEQ